MNDPGRISPLGVALLAAVFFVGAYPASAMPSPSSRSSSDYASRLTESWTGNLTQDAQIELTSQGYTSVEGIAVGDVDNDGKNELIANYDWYISPGGIPKTVIYEKGASGWSLDGEITNFTMLLRPGYMVQGLAHIVVGDADNDGKNELLIPGKYNGTERLYLFKYLNGSYQVIWSSPSKDGEIADLDSDGKNEVIAPNDGIYRWDGSKFVKLTSFPGVDGVRLGDVNADGRIDVVLPAGTLGATAYTWKNGSMASIGSASDTGFIMSGIGVGDTDGDGEDEVFVIEYHNKMAVFGWNGSGLAMEWNGSFGGADNPTDGWVADVDSDGLAEIFGGGGNSAGAITIKQWEYDGSGYVSTWDSGPLSLYCHSFGNGDADNDGLPELVAGSGSNGRAWVYSPLNVTPGPPGPPRLVSAVAGDSSVDLSWSPPSSTGGSAITNYRIYRGTSPGGESFLAETGPATGFPDGGLANGVTYYYRVSAKNVLGEGLKSSSVSATPGRAPSAPTGLAAAGGNLRIDVTWAAPSDTGGLPLGSYRLFRGTSNGVHTFTKDLAPSMMSYADLPLPGNTTFYYSITAWNAVGEGPKAAEVSAKTDEGPPAPFVSGFGPAGPTGTLLDTQGHVSFTEKMDPATTVAAFSITPPIPATLSVTGHVLYWNHTAPLASNTTYTFSVSTGAKSRAGVNLAAPFSHSFTTTAKSPVRILVTIEPPDGSNDVPVDVVVLISFSVRMDPTSVYAALLISPKPNYGAGFDSDYRILTISFSEPLKPGTAYTVTLLGSARAADGTFLSGDVRALFATAGAPPWDGSISSSAWPVIIFIGLLVALLAAIPIYVWRSRRALKAASPPVAWGQPHPAPAVVAKAQKYSRFESTLGMIFISGFVSLLLTGLILFLMGFFLGGALGLNLSALSTPGFAYGMCFLIWFILGGLALYGSRLGGRAGTGPEAGALPPPPPSYFQPLPPPPPPPAWPPQTPRPPPAARPSSRVPPSLRGHK